MDKIDEKTKRLHLWMNGKPQPPYTIELIPTHRCNFNCASCWRQSVSREEIEKKYSEELSDERLLRLIDEAAEIGVKEIAFVGGGEPLARDVTFELMKRIRKHNMEGDLVTNGSLLTKKIIETLVDIGWTRVKFSMDGSNPGIQDKLRREKCFNRIIKNIKLLSETKKKKNKDLPRIGFNVVVSNENYKDLPNIIELAYKTGCNEILLLPITVFSEEGKKLKMDYDQMVEFQQIIKDCLPKLKEYGIFSNMDKFIDLRYIDKTNSMHEVVMEEAEKAIIKEKINRGEKLIEDMKKDPKENFIFAPCFEPWSHITIIANGNIACCFNDYVWNTKITIKDYTIKELWYGPYFERYRKQILTRKLPEACATCCVWRIFEIKSIRDRLQEYSQGSLFEKIKMRL